MIFNDFDVLLMPTSPSTAFKMGENPNDPVAAYLADIFTVLANLVGIPVSPSRYINTATACHSSYRLATQTGDELTFVAVFRKADATKAALAASFPHEIFVIPHSLYGSLSGVVAERNHAERIAGGRHRIRS